MNIALSLDDYVAPEGMTMEHSHTGVRADPREA